tara:strand:- start:196 stop:474 length:279 start_codon:yes stop_codon:yes gene_type:complete
VIYTDLFKVQEKHLESKLELISQEFIEFNYDKKLSQLTLEEAKELQDFAFLHVSSVMCFGIRKCIRVWEELKETTVEGGEYLRELNLREGED